MNPDSFPFRFPTRRERARRAMAFRTLTDRAFSAYLLSEASAARRAASALEQQYGPHAGDESRRAARCHVRHARYLRTTNV